VLHLTNGSFSRNAVCALPAVGLRTALHTFVCRARQQDWAVTFDDRAAGQRAHGRHACLLAPLGRIGSRG
jgi:hypothetical protein